MDVPNVPMALFYAFAMTMFPIGLKVGYLFMGNPITILKNNAGGREKRNADWLLTRLGSIEANSFEAVHWIAIAVLAAGQAGVATAEIALYTKFWRPPRDPERNVGVREVRGEVVSSWGRSWGRP